MEGKEGKEITFIPDRLIEEPVVFRGMTDTELVYVILGGLVIWIPVCILLMLPFGYGLFGVGVGFAMAIVTVVMAGRYLTRLKRRMPEGQHIVYLKRLLQEKGIKDYGFILSTQYWDVTRTNQVKRKGS